MQNSVVFTVTRESVDRTCSFSHTSLGKQNFQKYSIDRTKKKNRKTLVCSAILEIISIIETKTIFKTHPLFNNNNNYNYNNNNTTTILSLKPVLDTRGNMTR